MFSNNANNEVQQFAMAIKEALGTIYDQMGEKLPIETQNENKAFQYVIQFLKGERNVDNDTITALKIVKELISKWKQMKQMSTVTSNIGNVFNGNSNQPNHNFGNSGFNNSNIFGNKEVVDDSFITLPGDTNESIKETNTKVFEQNPIKEKKPEITVDNVSDFYEPEEDSIFKPLIDETRFMLTFVITKNDKFEYRVQKIEKDI